MTGAAPAPPLGPRPTDAARRADIARMRRRATGLLVLAAAVFVAARLLEARHPWLAAVRATAEASLVGGLADWFAVTALFRHPLGLPIPHTAIVRRQKDRIARILGEFVQTHFLVRDVVAARLRALDLSARVATWLSAPANGERLARHLARGAARAADALPRDEVARLLREAAASGLQETNLAPLAGTVLSLATAEGRHRVLVDAALPVIAGAVTASEGAIRDAIRAESPRWVPSAVQDAIHARVLRAIERFLADVARDPAHPARARVDAAVEALVERLRHAPEMAARADALRDAFLGHPVAEEAAQAVWEALRRMVERWERDPTGAPAAFVGAVARAADQLLANAALRRELDDFLVDAVAGLVDGHRAEVAALIEHTVSQWDPDLAADRVELAVGRDLQYIRINGTLVGGIAGLGLFLLSRLAG